MRRSMIIGLGVVAAAAAAAGAVWWSRHAPPGPARPQEQAQPPREQGRRPDGSRPVPVVSATVGRKDLPVYLDGLGTVQASSTVTVRSRVDGELVEVGFKEGEDVRAGQMLARIDARTYQAALDQTAAAKAKDEAQLELARLDLQRYQGLGNRVPGQTVDTQRATVKQLEATVKVDQALIDNARTMLGYTTITSPIDGRTGLRQVDRGNIVHAADAGGLVVVAQMQPIAVLFTLPQQSLPAINEETRRQGKLPVLVTDSAGAVLDRGTLELVDNQIDQTTGTIKLKALFANAERKLWPGGFVNVRLLLTTRHDAVVVPATVVQRGPQGAYAFLVKPDRTVEMRRVTVGPVEADEAVIETGLDAGDTVVTDGMAKLQAGSRVTDVREHKDPAGAPAGQGGERPGGEHPAGERPAGEHHRDHGQGQGQGERKGPPP